MSKSITKIALGFVLLVLAEGIRGVFNGSGIDFVRGEGESATRVSFDEVAEAAVQSGRPDLIPLLKHFDTAAVDGKEREVFVQYTPQGRRVETVPTLENVLDIAGSISELGLETSANFNKLLAKAQKAQPAETTEPAA